MLSVLAWPAAAEYKPEFKLSLVITSDTAWGRAATRFADVLRYRTQGRINIKTYFEGQLFKGRQTTEFVLVQEGEADFAMGSTINWSAQVKELNLFALPFLFPSSPAVDAVQVGNPGKRLFGLLEQKGVVPARSTKLLERQFVRGFLPVLCRCIILTLTLIARKSYQFAHGRNLPCPQ